MSKHGLISRDWGDGTYDFRLSLEGIEEIEERFDRSIFAIARRCSAFDATFREVSELIRVGLIGGGMKPVDALAKVRVYVDARPYIENMEMAYEIAEAGLQRVHGDEVEDPPGKPRRAKRKGSTSPKSEETAS